MKDTDCCKSWGWVLLIVGVIFILRDLGYIGWWTFEWYTVVFTLLGLKWALAK